MSGGNIFVYEQLMEQKMMLQMLMMRQAAADAAGNQEKGSASRRAGRDRQNGAGANNLQNGTLPARRTKKTLPTPQTSTAAAASTLKKSEATPPLPRKPPRPLPRLWSRPTHPIDAPAHGLSFRQVSAGCCRLTGVNVKSWPFQSISTTSDGLTFCSSSAVASELASRC